MSNLIAAENEGREKMNNIISFALKECPLQRSVNFEMYFLCLQFFQKTNEKNSTQLLTLLRSESEWPFDQA